MTDKKKRVAKKTEAATPVSEPTAPDLAAIEVPVKAVMSLIRAESGELSVMLGEQPNAIAVSTVTFVPGLKL